VNRIVEIVPNISEGRRPGVVQAVVAAAEAVPEVFVLDFESDPDHNRSVITAAGPPRAVLEAAFRIVEKAAELIDLTAHEGQHPRMGAADVVPFVPVEGVDMTDCVELARQLGRQVADKLEVPVFLYGEAAATPERQSLAWVRKGQFEGLRETVGSDPDRNPDFGPARVHPTAGATAVGARFFLLAFNVNLATPDVRVAKKIAKEIRESSGGLPGVRALGLFLAEKNLAQVSMNLLDYRRTSPARVVEVIAGRARELGVEVLESELVGLAPGDALIRSAAEALKITGFQDEMIVEKNLRMKMQKGDA
jgi:glutamate formiminotransferase